jgi:MFS family permease
LTGKIYKYFNTKWTFLVFFAVFEIGSVICGAANSSAVFIVGRFIAGFGGAGVATGTIAIVSNSAPLERRAGERDRLITTSDEALTRKFG